MSYQPNTGGGNNITTDISDAVDNARLVTYKCGDCDQEVKLKRGEPIRCRNCGHRVLYKQRTTRMVQFEAR
ncbi:DNA directed RNA polymerase [Dendryphion nanum]|uniref:DNA directed RNA polymerase n=1 Tax=Dendryphion nanum TaxID=256645 RepID=A0A9P9D8S2_9PLEO|nr:DNA directed RNA polymerase [Dendryphion nanum]